MFKTSVQRNPQMTDDFFEYSRQNISQSRAGGHHNAAHNREAALRCLGQYLGENHLPFADLSSTLMAQFKNWLTAGGRKETTARLYVNQISAIYNAAVKEGLAPNLRLLKGIKTTMPVRPQRPILTEDELRRMRNADLSNSRSMTFARDMFLFSIYARGMTFTDIAHIRKSDINGPSLTYTSPASNPPRVTVPWDVAMQEIADRYPSTTDFLFPFLTSGNKLQASREIKRIRENVVNALKKIAVRCHLSVVPSFYMSKDIYQRALDKVCVSRII